MNKAEERKFILAMFRVLTDFLAEVYGESVEIVLHELYEDCSAIIALRNGHISNRKIGQEKDDVLKKQIQLSAGSDYSVNRFHKTVTGGDMKSNSFFIKDSQGELIGILCVNVELSSLITLNKLTERFLKGFLNSSPEDVRSGDEEEETIEEYTYRTMKNIIKQADIPIERMTMEEKIEVLRRLKEKGVFRIKGVVREVARQLEVSETSIYRYLREIE